MFQSHTCRGRYANLWPAQGDSANAGEMGMPLLGNFFLNAEGAKSVQPGFGFLCRPALKGYAINCWTTQEAQDLSIKREALRCDEEEWLDTCVMTAQQLKRFRRAHPPEKSSSSSFSSNSYPGFPTRPAAPDPRTGGEVPISEAQRAAKSALNPSTMVG